MQLPTERQSDLPLCLFGFEERIYMLVSAYLLHLGLSCCQYKSYFSFSNGAQVLSPCNWLVSFWCFWAYSTFCLSHVNWRRGRRITVHNLWRLQELGTKLLLYYTKIKLVLCFKLIFSSFDLHFWEFNYLYFPFLLTNFSLFFWSSLDLSVRLVTADTGEYGCGHTLILIK